jgi:hypothetical protein
MTPQNKNNNINQLQSSAAQQTPVSNNPEQIAMS